MEKWFQNVQQTCSTPLCDFLLQKFDFWQNIYWAISELFWPLFVVLTTWINFVSFSNHCAIFGLYIIHRHTWPENIKRYCIAWFSSSHHDIIMKGNAVEESRSIPSPYALVFFMAELMEGDMQLPATSLRCYNFDSLFQITSWMMSRFPLNSNQVLKLVSTIF